MKKLKKLNGATAEKPVVEKPAKAKAAVTKEREIQGAVVAISNVGTKLLKRIDTEMTKQNFTTRAAFLRSFLDKNL